MHMDILFYMYCISPIIQRDESCVGSAGWLDIPNSSRKIRLKAHPSIPFVEPTHPYFIPVPFPFPSIQISIHMMMVARTGQDMTKRSLPYEFNYPLREKGGGEGWGKGGVEEKGREERSVYWIYCRTDG